MRYMLAIVLMTLMAGSVVAAEPATTRLSNMTTADIDAKWRELRQTAGPMPTGKQINLTTADIDAKWREIRGAAAGQANTRQAEDLAQQVNRCLFGHSQADGKCRSVGQARDEDDGKGAGRNRMLQRKLGLPGN